MKKKTIEEEPEEIKEDMELKEDDYLREQDRLFYQIVEESFNQILKYIQEGNTYKAQELVELIEHMNPPEGKKEFRLVMDVLDKISRRY